MQIITQRRSLICSRRQQNSQPTQPISVAHVTGAADWWSHQSRPRHFFVSSFPFLTARYRLNILYKLDLSKDGCSNDLAELFSVFYMFAT